MSTMSLVAPTCHRPIDGIPGWNIAFPAHAVAAVLPPPRSYYVVSWVPRALPEVVQLIKEIPMDHERCLINKHFELGMLVMRRCGVQNPEEIKCLLDGFREGTTRLSNKESGKTPNDDVSTKLSADGNAQYAPEGFCCSPTVERRKLLIFFNDHRASRPWVLCPARHCIKSARTTGKVKGRVKIFQYEQRSSSVKVPKLFIDCLSSFLTKDQYVFATFCPQQKYTDHELDWFDLPPRPHPQSHGYSAETGGDAIFRELVDEHDAKGTRVWPFDDYIIFANSQAKIVAVFKKKLPLLTSYRQTWLGGVDDCGSTTASSSLSMDSFLPSSPELCQALPTSVKQKHAESGEAPTEVLLCQKPPDPNMRASLAALCSAPTSLDYGNEERHGNDSFSQSEGRADINGRHTYGRGYNMKNYVEASSQLALGPESDYDTSSDKVEDDNTSDNCELNRRVPYQRGDAHTTPYLSPFELDKVSELNSSTSHLLDAFGRPINNTLSQIQSSVTPPPAIPAAAVSPSELLRQAEEAERVLVRIMTSVLARLDPLDDPDVVVGPLGSSAMDRQSVYKTDQVLCGHHPAYRVSDDATGYCKFSHTDSNSHSSMENEDNMLEGRSATTTASSAGDSNDMGHAGSGSESVGHDSSYVSRSTNRNMELGELDAKRRKVMTFPAPSNAILYHDLVRQFLSRLAFGLDHPPLPQKRIPDTVKRVVTKIVAESIREVNLALLTSSIRCQSGDGLQPEDHLTSSAMLSPTLDAVTTGVRTSPYQSSYCSPTLAANHHSLTSSGVVLTPNPSSSFFLSYNETTSAATTDCCQPLPATATSSASTGSGSPSQPGFSQNYTYNDTLSGRNLALCPPLGASTVFGAASAPSHLGSSPSSPSLPCNFASGFNIQPTASEQSTSPPQQDNAGKVNLSSGSAAAPSPSSSSSRYLEEYLDQASTSMASSHAASSGERLLSFQHHPSFFMQTAFANAGANSVPQSMSSSSSSSSSQDGVDELSSTTASPVIGPVTLLQNDNDHDTYDKNQCDTDVGTQNHRCHARQAPELSGHSSSNELIEQDVMAEIPCFSSTTKSGPPASICEQTPSDRTAETSPGHGVSPTSSLPSAQFPMLYLKPDTPSQSPSLKAQSSLSPRNTAPGSDNSVAIGAEVPQAAAAAAATEGSTSKLCGGFPRSVAQVAPTLTAQEPQSFTSMIVPLSKPEHSALTLKVPSRRAKRSRTAATTSLSPTATTVRRRRG